MPKFLYTHEPEFWTQLQNILTESAHVSETTVETVRSIIRDVSTKGDEALLKYTNQFDKTNYVASDLRVKQQEIKDAIKSCDPEVIEALKEAATRIEEYHFQQVPDSKTYKDVTGTRLGWRWSAIENVGLYVPGGAASYPSSVLMNAIPARVAGVKRLVMVVPAPKGVVSPVVLAAAYVAGVQEIYKIGGAQAIAALAYGTPSIPQVDKVVGPGNQYVAEAKRQVFGLVGIDMIAGPSEILVISDEYTNPAWVAADLMSQAEHDVMARSILVTDNEAFAKKVYGEVDKLLEQLSRRAIAKKSWEERGLIVIVKNMDEAVKVANKVAPEHLELACNNPSRLFRRIQNAGAVFVGRYTPEAIGDYMAGPSHVLPTSGTARFSSGLGVFDFIKRTSIISCDEKAFSRLARSTKILADHEGLTAHAKSVDIRIRKK